MRKLFEYENYFTLNGGKYGLILKIPGDRDLELSVTVLFSHAVHSGKMKINKFFWIRFSFD